MMNECVALDCIADAFAEVEKNDIRVSRIVLKHEDYHRLLFSPLTSLSRVFINNPILLKNRGMAGALGQLWGARVDIGNESKVYGERGFVPYHLRHNVSQEVRELSPYSFDPNYEYGVELNFNGLRWKLQRLKGNLTIIVKSRADPLKHVSRSESKALETLREMITEIEYRKYLKYGFVCVYGRSGRTYQIFRNKAHTKVWEHGMLVEEICVRINHNIDCPPTDNVIAFKTLIEISEHEFRSLGNVYNMRRAA
jgi:hypothetical protein